MVVAVITMRMMQVPVHQVADVVAVGNRRVSAVRAVNVVCIMAPAVVGGAAVGVGFRDRDGVLVVVAVMRAVEVPVVQVPHVVAVPNRDVAAVRAMLVVVVFVNVVAHACVSKGQQSTSILNLGKAQRRALGIVMTEV